MWLWRDPRRLSEGDRSKGYGEIRFEKEKQEDIADGASGLIQVTPTTTLGRALTGTSHGTGATH